MKLLNVLIAAGLLVTATPVFAQSALDAVKQAGVLRIGTEGTYAPFTFHDASGALVGFDVEIGRAIAAQIGVEPEFVEGPWDGLIAGIDANRYDVVINQVGINAERQAKYDFSEPYIASKAALVVRADNTDITSFESLKGKNAAQSLTSNFGFASEALRDLTTGGARQFSVGPLALSLPLFDGGRNKANLALAKARYEEALANHQGRLLTALREVEDALSDVQQRQLQGDAQAQSQQAAARAYLVAKARYERGLSNYLDVTDAQRSALAADRAAAQIRTQRLLASSAVARALGGGWQQDPAVATIARAPAAH